MVVLALVPEWIIITYIGALGAVVGSFINVVIARLPEEQSLVRPRSRCPKCGSGIAWYDNIPILSYLALRGRCRSCSTRIAMRYPLVEFLMMSLAIAGYLRFGISWEMLTWFPLAAGSLAIIFLDIDHWWVPDVLTYPGMIFAGAAAFLPGGLEPDEALFGLLPAAGLFLIGWTFQKLTGREGMGLGDIKLLAVIGLALGAVDTLAVLIFASVEGTVIGLLVLLTGGHKSVDDLSGEAAGDRDATVEETAQPEAEPPGDVDTEEDEEDWEPDPRAFPFGPFLVIAAYQVVLLPEIFATLPARFAYALLELLQ